MEIIGVKSKKSTNIHIQTTIKLKDILNSTHVEVFDPHNPLNYGYQRKIEPLHIRRLISYIKNKDKDVSFPTPVVLGVLKSDCKIKTMDSFSSTDLVQLEIKPNTKLNIIDGQHRIRALESASKDIPEILENEIMCVISIVENREFEIQTFININSKAKKIKPDLALLALNKLNMVGDHFSNFSSVADYIAINTAYMLNQDKKSVWFNAIKFDFNEEEALTGYVGISSFVDSITSIITFELSENFSDVEISYDTTEKLSLKFKNLLNDYWSVIRSRWPSTFNHELTDSITGYHYFNPQYEIQKYSGYNAFHTLLRELYKQSRSDSEMLEKFKKIIKNSKITAKNWEKGGQFSGRTSGTAIKKSVEEIASSSGQ